MRKFKLIKNFCDSGLQEGDIITFPENSNIAEYRKTGESSFLQFTLSEIEKYTENWEEIIELDKLPEKWFVVPQTEENLKFIKQYDPSCSTYRITNINNAYRNNTTNTGLIYHTSFKSIDSEFVKITIKDFKKFVLDKKKDYEILSFKGNKNHCKPGHIVLIENEMLKTDDMVQKLPLSHFLNAQVYDIHSVKRLSDGEIFTIGDLVSRHKSWEKTTPCYISGFKFKKDKLTYNIKQNNMFGNYPFDDVTYKYELKKSLFTTEDGVDIFEGDKIFSVDRNKLTVYDNNRMITINFCRSSVYKYFSTKEAAEEYNIKNKPCLSYNDIVEMVRNQRDDNSFIDSPMAQSLFELAKSKV